jgi:hypothetical protein
MDVRPFLGGIYFGEKKRKYRAKLALEPDLPAKVVDKLLFYVDFLVLKKRYFKLYAKTYLF